MNYVTKGTDVVGVQLFKNHQTPIPTKFEQYVEFDAEDGKALADAFLKVGVTKAGAFDECLMSLIIASGRQDKTTINGCVCARRYMRANEWDK